MIVDDRGGDLVLIEQEVHAQLTGELAAQLPFLVPHHAAFVAAARLHDNGWREADQAPTVDDRGRPHTFTTVPDHLYEDIWRRGIERAAAVDALLGLLVGLHGARFFGSRDSEGMRRLVADERRRQNEVLAELELGGTWDALPEGVAEASEWIAMLDALSLLLCGASLPDELPAKVCGRTYTMLREGNEVTVDPWPYETGPETFLVRTRRLAADPYESDEGLRAAVGRAPVEDLGVTVRPPS